MPSRKSSLKQPPTNAHPPLHSTNCHRTTWGIFEVACDRSVEPFGTPAFSRKSFLDHQHSALAMLRFLCEVYFVAPKPLILYLLCCLWVSIAPAFSLYLINAVLDMIQIAIHTQGTTDRDVRELQGLTCIWVFSMMLSTLVESLLTNYRLKLSAHLSSHFLPKLAKASFHLNDSPQDNRLRHMLPSASSFGEDPPGLTMIVDLLAKMRNTLMVAFEVLTFVHVISTKNTLDARFLQMFGCLFLGIMFFAPTNGVGGAGYTFWTTNESYHKLSRLHAMIFDEKFRETLTKDGTSHHICEVYRRTARALGVVSTNTFSLACHLPPPWYWLLGRDMVVEYPIALFALTLPWTISSCSLATMIILQYATINLRQSIYTLRGGQDTPSLSAIFHGAEALGRMLELGTQTTGTTRSYPTPLSTDKGMRLRFQQVSLGYQNPLAKGSTLTAVKNVSFNVSPGQLVVIVGGNGSGKTSLLNLLTGLVIPTSGKIFIDNRPLTEYDTLQLRTSIAFLTQHEEIYPISLQDNVLIGVPGMDSSENQGLVDEAARLGGSFDLIQRLGYDTILNPPAIVGQSLKGCGNGEIGPGAIAELKRHSMNTKNISISGGERQRLVASRTFMRLKNSNVKLLIVDEPTSALDPIAERDLFNQFLSLREGKTIILVTHRFGNIVKHADLILCMKSGRIVERGTHDSLISRNGPYTALYKAQVDCLE